MGGVGRRRRCPNDIYPTLVSRKSRGGALPRVVVAVEYRNFSIAQPIGQSAGVSPP